MRQTLPTSGLESVRYEGLKACLMTKRMHRKRTKWRVGPATCRRCSAGLGLDLSRRTEADPDARTDR
jgi:hypothetical protein